MAQWGVNIFHATVDRLHFSEEQNMTNLIRKFAVVLAALFLSFALSACEEEGPAEQAGEAVDDAAEQTSEAVDDAMEKTGEAMDDAAEKMEDAAEEVEKSAE